MLLLSFMIIALNSFSGSGTIYAYADEQADTPAVAEQTAHDAESETTAETGEITTEETETTSESAETTEQVKTTSEPETESAAEADETEYAAFDESITVDGVKVRVTADAGVFPEGATLRVEKLKGVDREEAMEAVDEETGDLDIAKEYLFDITILDKDGNEIQPEGKANVSFETSEVADETLEAKVYHVKDNGKAESLDVDASGEIAQVETTGFSPYSLIFSYTDSSGKTKSINLRVGETYQIGPVLDKIGIPNAEQDARGGIANAVSDAPDIVRVYEHEWAGWFCELMAADENEHHLTVTFKDGYKVTVKVTSHKHHWTAKGDKTDALTIVCEDPQNCYYFNNVYFDDKAFTAQISAEDATYDGQPHGAEKELQQRFPTPDVPVEKDIHYVGIDDTTYADSTTAPTDAGKYKAYYEVKPQGQDDVFTVQTEYTIKKADIIFDPAPTAVSNLIYNGQDQDLYTLGIAKSKVISDKTFPIKYWYAEGSGQKVEDEILKGKDAGTVKVSYQAEGDANHNATEVKTIEIKIGKRPVKVSGITASNKTYDGTTAATLDCSGAIFGNILQGDTLTVSAKGAFADKNAGNNKTVSIADLTLGGADADKYTLDTTGQQGSTTANITAKTLKVKWQESAELPYTGEEQAPEAEFEFAENLSDGDGKAYTGDDVQPVITGKHKELAVWTASVDRLTGENAGNYKLDPTTSNVKMEYQIVPKKITVDWKVIEKEYAAEGLEPDWELAGFVGGDKPNKHLTLTANPTELVGNQAVNAGTYKATLELTGETASNYKITNPESAFTITKAPLKVYAEGWIYYGDKIETKADIHDIKYDKDKCEGFKGRDGVGVLKGDAEFTTDYKFKDNATGVDGAKYNLIAQNVEAANYDIKGADGELTVYPKPVVLEWSHEHAGNKEAVSGDQAFTYDGKNHVYTAAVKDASDVSVETYKGNKQRDANAKTNTEKYTAEAITLSNPNYALTDKDGKTIGTTSVDFTIAQLPVELEWTPAEFTYNGQLQTPAETVANLQTDDEGTKDKVFEISVKREKTSEVFDKERGESIEAGDWTISAVNEESNQLKDKNYTLEGGKGLSSKYVIKPLTIDVTWTTPQEYTYNAQQQSQKVETNIAEDDQDYIELIDEDASATDVGTYTHKITGIEQKGEKNRADNYEFTAKTRSWKINQASLTVTAKNKTISYGQNPANGGVTYSGFKGNDDASVLKGSVRYSYNYARYGKPGSYKITASGLSSDNYKISYKPGTLKVNNKVTRLMAKAIAKGSNKGVISWTKVTGATSYEIWLSRCNAKGRTYNLKKVATVKSTKWTTGKLSGNTFYKFRIVARTSSGKISSSIGRFATGNASGKYTNAKNLSVNKTAVSIAKGKTFKIRAKSAKVRNNLKLPTNHASNFRYFTDNSKVAKVSSSGVIKGVGKGWCRVYVQTGNGIWKIIQVTVK